MQNYGDFVWDIVVADFNRCMDFGSKIFEMSPLELVKNGIVDPVKVFIKPEPHSWSKFLSGKLRIISSVSLKEQIKGRLLGNLQNKAEIAVWETCPSAPGMGLDDLSLKLISGNFREFLEQGTAVETDISGWDWSVAAWELEADALCRTRLAGAEDDSAFGFLTRVHAYCVANAVYVTPDGKMYEQLLPGGQLSGDQWTSSTNSRARVLASMAARMLAGLPLIHVFKGRKRLNVKAMGDDSVEVAFAGLKEGLEKIGHTVKMVKENLVLEGLSFCSQIFRSDGMAYPENPSKTFYRFCSHKPSDPNYSQFEAQLMWYFRHLPSDVYRKLASLARARVERAQNLLDKPLVWLSGQTEEEIEHLEGEEGEAANLAMHLSRTGRS